MSNSIPLRYRIRSRHKGAIPQPRDFRDIVLGDIDFVHDPKCPSWEKGFDNEVKYGRLKRNHQGSSLSCVGQGWSKHAEMLDKIEKANGTRLSARYIYSQILILPLLFPDDKIKLNPFLNATITNTFTKIRFKIRVCTRLTTWNIF